MGLDISVKYICKTIPKTKEERTHYFRLTDSSGNYYPNLNFPQWTKKYEKTKIITEYDWEKYKEETGININEYNFYCSTENTLEVYPQNIEFPVYNKSETWEDYEKKLQAIIVKIDLSKVPTKKIKIKVLYHTEIGYQRKGLNSQFYQDYRDGKIGYFVWSKDELIRYKKDYSEPGMKSNFQKQIINNFTESECCVIFDW